MRVTVLKRTGNELRLEIEGEGHSFCGVIQSALLRDASVDYSGYYIDHPLEARPELYLRTKGGNKPEDALLKAVDALKSELNSIREVFRQAVSTEDNAINE
jgi:DNA-directed RNA polymerase subunit L